MKVFGLKSIVCLIIICLVGIRSLDAQVPDRPSKAEVETQKVFIEATREKLLGNYQDAAYLFKKVLSTDPKNHVAAYELSRMYEVLDKPSKALQAIEKAVKLSPDNVWYKDLYAQILEENNKFAKAASVYKDLSVEHPDNEYFKFQRAEYLVKADKPEEAIAVYDELEKQLGVNEELTRKKYSLYYGMGNGKKAIGEIKTLIAAFPEEVNYHHILADYYNKEGQPEKAKSVYQKILKINPEDPEANLALADSFKGGGEHLRYLNAIKPIIGKTDVGIDVKVKELFPFIGLLEETEDENLKIATLEMGELLVAAHPTEAKAHSLYADMLYKAGKSEEALAEYEKTLGLNKNVYAVWEQIMYINLELQRYDQVIEVSEKAMDVFPNQARVYYMNGLGQSVKGKHSDAIYMLQQALMMSGRNLPLKYDIYNRLGTEFFHAKKFDKSNNMFEKALELAPEKPEALNSYSLHLAKRGEQLEKAEQMSRKVNEIAPGKAFYEAVLGLVLCKSDNLKEAKNWFGKSLGNGGDQSPDILEYYGDYLYKSGDKTAAVEYWNKAKSLGGDNKQLDKKINEQGM